MIRFRFAEDEQRYLLLVGALQRQLATQLPPEQVSVAMRNLGKLQDLLMMEGIRQGATAANIGRELAAGEITKSPGPLLKPFELHAAVYGTHDTPLHAVEQQLLSPLHETPPWLDDAPMQFAPTPQDSGAAPIAPTPPSTSAPKSWDHVADEDIRQEARRYWEERPPREGDFHERPELLDRARDALVGMVQRGDPVSTWTDLILRLHLALQVDAGFLDIQMSTPMGLTVLHQAGFHDLRPPALMDQAVFLDGLSRSGDLPKNGT